MIRAHGSQALGIEYYGETARAPALGQLAVQRIRQTVTQLLSNAPEQQHTEAGVHAWGSAPLSKVRGCPESLMIKLGAEG